MQKISKSTTYIIWLAPIILVLAYWVLNPFSEVLVSQTVSLRQLSAAQKSNIIRAAKSLDGYILCPKQAFSFNKIIGPRTFHEGYTLSGSYLGPDTLMTYGGGICLLSSLVYKNAIEIGLPIAERTAHTRTTACIPAGYDATVWYGRRDLKFTNNLDRPLKFKAIADSGKLTVSIMASGFPRADIGHLQRSVKRIGANAVEVTVLRSCGNQLALVSRDFYTLAQVSKQPD